jgi:hypothetical protein
MSISTAEFIIAIIIAFLLAAILAWLFLKQRKDISKGAIRDAVEIRDTADHTPGIPSRQLQLQAYERLILLTDRIAIPNLIQRVNQPGLDAKEMQTLLTHSIRQEFEHNITQQIYVSPEAWDAVRNFKEQNLLIVNQVASFLPPEASGSDLNRSLLDLLVQNPKASLQNIVSEALSFEAKKVM